MRVPGSNLDVAPRAAGGPLTHPVLLAFGGGSSLRGWEVGRGPDSMQPWALMQRNIQLGLWCLSYCFLLLLNAWLGLVRSGARTLSANGKVRAFSVGGKGDEGSLLVIYTIRMQCELASSCEEGAVRLIVGISGRGRRTSAQTSCGLYSGFFRISRSLTLEDSCSEALVAYKRASSFT